MSIQVRHFSDLVTYTGPVHGADRVLDEISTGIARFRKRDCARSTRVVLPPAAWGNDNVRQNMTGVEARMGGA
jgi:hypothetical protein